MADTAYLKLRRGKNRSGASYYVRIVVPTDLRDVLGKKTIERSLHTSDPKEAKRRKHAVVAEIFADFDRARQRRITSADIEHEAQRYLRERLQVIQARPGDTFQPITDEYGREYPIAGEVVLPWLHEALEKEDWPNETEREAADIARRYGTALTDRQHHELCRALLLAEIEALSRVLNIHDGVTPEPLGVLNARAVDPITAALMPRPALAPKKGAGIRVKEAAAAYIADRNRESKSAWTGQTLSQVQSTLRLFADFTRDAPLAAITRNDVATFLNTVARLEPNYGRHANGEELNLESLLRKHAASGSGGLSNKTLNRHGGVIAVMFEWAIRSGKIEGNNPAKGHHRSSGENGDETGSGRRHFTVGELKKLFDGPLFTGTRGERIQPKRHTVETALAWIIPIALFSGMRLDEICSLRSEDVIREEDILHFDLVSHEGRRLKTAAARRRVPVHTGLSRIGFENYLTHVRQQGHEYLFPALKPGGPDGKRSWYVSKRFTTYRRSVGVTDPGTVFHCFRKNAATALERAHIPENEAVQILGHKKMTMSYGLYSGGLDLARLARVIEAINYPGLHISYL